MKFKYIFVTYCIYTVCSILTYLSHNIFCVKTLLTQFCYLLVKPDSIHAALPVLPSPSLLVNYILTYISEE